MTYAEYLNTMTVKTLSEIAKREGIAYSGLKKAELISKLVEYINGWHVIALDMNRASSHIDNPTVIDSEEFPMDHVQWLNWYNRHGGIESFDVNMALASDHSEALDMEADYNAEIARLVEENRNLNFKSLTVKDRMDNYKAQTGGYLTKRQQRRIVKKYAKALKRGFSLETVTGFKVA